MADSVIYTLMWRYRDGSACGIVRAYEDHADGETDLKMLQDMVSDREFNLIETPII